MPMGLTQALKKGDSFPLTLSFETAGDVTVIVDVLGMGMGMGAKEAECADAQP